MYSSQDRSTTRFRQKWTDEKEYFSDLLEYFKFNHNCFNGLLAYDAINTTFLYLADCTTIYLFYTYLLFNCNAPKYDIVSVIIFLFFSIY